MTLVSKYPLTRHECPYDSPRRAKSVDQTSVRRRTRPQQAGKRLIAFPRRWPTSATLGAAGAE